jgi:hypothetical protein
MDNRSRHKGWTVLRAGALATSALFSLLPSLIRAEPLATTLVTRPVSSPAAAWARFGTSTTRASGPIAPLVATPELISLAKGLGSERTDVTNAQYARSVFDYVRNNITTEFGFGLGTGWHGALIAQSTTPLDKADLVVKLLKQRTGLAPTFRVGVIGLAAVEFGRWSGFVNGVGGAGSAACPPPP